MAAQTTSITPSQMPSANPAVAQGSRSTVLWNGSTLQVEASNAGLNGLLQEIARKTGMKLTGTAPEERIFGRYGPGSLDDVVSRLLDGVSVNVMLLNPSAAGGRELVLTGRTGRPTPPNPSARDDATADAAMPGLPGPSGFGRSNATTLGTQQPAGGAPQTDANGTQAAPATAAPATAAPGTTAADGTQPALSPNGVKTPQEIYEQLQRLRSQQAK